MCLAAIYWARMDAIYYGNTSADAARIDFDAPVLYREICLPHEVRMIPSTGLLGGEAWESFQEWRDSTIKVEF